MHNAGLRWLARERDVLANTGHRFVIHMMGEKVVVLGMIIAGLEFGINRYCGVVFFFFFLRL